MIKKNDHGKITLGMLKGKPVTTSVPQISIKFHANAEQIEELYVSEDESLNKNDEKGEKITTASSTPSNLGESDSSPLKYFNKIGKRSTSVDVTTQPLSASPPSDPWRFFSDIKGKITKSVEDKITEIKSRNNEEGSPSHKSKSEATKSDLKTIADSKENSSVSDSEDLSESSISKTCGLISTTEGVEMSSDEDTPSLEKDKKDTFLSVTPSSFKHKFRFFRKNHKEEGTIKTSDLSKIYNINTENKDQTLPEDSEGVESAVDALEETNIKSEVTSLKISNDEILKTVIQKIDNIEVDTESLINIKEVTGSEIRERYFDCEEEKTVFAPTGFVDLRPKATTKPSFSNYLSLLVLLLSFLVYGIIQYYSPYSAGLAAGIILSFIVFKIYLKIYPRYIEQHKPEDSTPLNKIFEVQAVKEYQPLEKYEGWLNEYPDVYNHETYHIFRTQSVFLRLQGNLLRISHGKNKVPKRAMWNESEIKANFTQHRVYNLLGANICLLPEGLAKIRQWSKKYPICISLQKDQLCFDQELLSKIESELQKHTESDNTTEKGKLFTSSGRDKKGFNKLRKKEHQYPVLSQRFSKLNEGDDLDFDSDSRASTPSADISDIVDSSPVLEDVELLCSKEDKNNEEGNIAIAEDLSIQDSNTNEIKLYLFGRTDREKEDWYRRLCTATHKNQNSELKSVYTSSNSDKDISDNLFEPAPIELEYLRYMSIFKPSRKSCSHPKEEKYDVEEPHDIEESKDDTLLCLNALIGRVLFDCGRNNSFIDKVKDRIQRKLSTIKLPYFIEELLIPEMSLGKTSPIIKRTGKPVIDERGIWIDLDFVYEGLIVLTLQTKLNLMRLKNPQAFDKSNVVKSAIYHSDVDDSAESSTDEEGLHDIPNTPQETHAGSSHGKKNLMKMVDRLAESKFFQAATENRYIKKAMEGVSNTHLRLKVEVKSLVGTLVLNIPPPPTDRVWMGFRPVPELSLSARPIVGERNISYIMVTSWIEKKLVQEFQKVLVIPNMEDLVIPVMNPKLPD